MSDQNLCPCAGNRQVVHCAIHGQFADRAAGEAQRLTTKLSVVIASRVPFIWTKAASPKGSVASVKMGTSKPSISRRVALPPAPWAISICGSLNFTLHAIYESSIGCMNHAPRKAPPTGFMFVTFFFFFFFFFFLKKMRRSRRSCDVRSCSRPRRNPRTNHQGADRPLRRAFVAEQLALAGFSTPLRTSPHCAALGSVTRTPGM